MLDYAFFQSLTAQIDNAADPDSADQLKALRTKILDTTAKQDEEARATMQRASELLKAILQADDPQAVARQRLDEIDAAFFAVLSANIQRAESENRKEMVQAFQQVANMVTVLLEDRLPPEVRLMNQLLNASYPDGTRQLLEAQRGILNTEFMDALEQIIAELEQTGGGDLATHMRQVKDQAEVIAQGVLQP